MSWTKNLSSGYTSDKNDYTEENGLFRKFLKQNILDISRAENGEAATFIVITKIPQIKTFKSMSIPIKTHDIFAD